MHNDNYYYYLCCIALNPYTLVVHSASQLKGMALKR